MEHIRNCKNSCSSSSSEIVAKSSQPPQNLCRPLKTFACVSLRYRHYYGGWVAIVVVVCGVKCVVKCVVKLKNCQIGEKNWCGSRYGPHDYDSGDKKTKWQRGKKAKRQKGKKAKRQKDKKNTKKTIKTKRQQKGQQNTKEIQKRTKNTTTKKTAGARTRGP